LAKSNLSEVVEDTAAQADADAVMMAADFSEEPPAQLLKSAEEQADMDNLIARKVAEGIAAAIPSVLAQIALTQSSEQQFAAGMGPSSTVNMKVGGDARPEASYLKHYRLDEAVNGKHQLLDVSKLDENGDFIIEELPGGKLRIPAVRKGEYINFVGGHFYATRQIEVDFVDHLMKTDPMCKIYESSEGNLLPCGE
jgi:hypothetical protein